MVPRIAHSRILTEIGLTAMLVGTIDPLEGCVIVLAGVGVVVLGAIVSKSRNVTLLSWAFGLVAFGVAAMIVLSCLGGIGGSIGLSQWWGVLLVPYPIGWIMALLGAIRSLLELRRFGASPS